MVDITKIEEIIKAIQEYYPGQEINPSAICTIDRARRALFYAECGLTYEWMIHFMRQETEKIDEGMKVFDRIKHFQRALDAAPLNMFRDGKKQLPWAKQNKHTGEIQCEN